MGDNKPRNNFAKFLIPAVLILVTAACSSPPKEKEWNPQQARAQWEKEVHKRIKDPKRAAIVTELAVQLELKNRNLTHLLGQFSQEMLAINRNYDSTREDYEQAFRSFTDKKNEALKQFLDAVFAMRMQTTPEEWKRLLN